MTKLAKAIGLVRQSRAYRTQASTCPKGSQSRQDRTKAADEYWVKAMWTLGRISSEAYRGYLEAK